jgi:DNA primase
MKVSFSEVDRLKIVELSCKTLWQEESQDVSEAMSYLVNTRKISENIIKEFRFGYYPSRLKREGHDWAGRLIMPLFDQHNELIVLTSRDFRCNDKTKMPHLHEEFNKKLFMYGMDVAKKNIIKYKKAIVVEGQFDTVCCHTFGFNFTVGILGSAFSLHHLCILTRYTQDIFLVFDTDESGLKNLARSMRMYKNYGLESLGVKFIPVCLPKHKDPDEFLKNEGKQSFLDLLAASKESVYELGVNEYYDDLCSKTPNLQLQGK